MAAEFRKAAALLAESIPSTNAVRVDLSHPAAEDFHGHRSGNVHGSRGSKKHRQIRGKSVAGTPADGGAVDLPFPGLFSDSDKRRFLAEIGVLLGDGPELRYQRQ